MSRPSIPEEIKRAVLVEAGHRCAIPRCGQTELDIHHIIPWETCKKHEYENLIALCPVCHRRVHQGDIDRKSLRMYKERLLSESGKSDTEQFSAEIIEIKRRISETNTQSPGFVFNFDFPDFREPSERIVSRNLEAWGNELLVQLREQQKNYESKYDEPPAPPPNNFRGQYRILRRDNRVISIKYTLDQYFSGAAHSSRLTRVQNFLLNPFQPVTLAELLNDDNESLTVLSSVVREYLLSEKKRNCESVIRGTEPDKANFELFNLQEYGILFTFSEYQIGCYAEGEQELLVDYYELKEIMNESVYQAVA